MLSDLLSLLTSTQLLAIGVLCVLISYLWPKKDPPNLPKGPRGWPILGNLPLLASNKDVPATLTNLKKIYGGLLKIQLGPVRLVVISDYKLVKEAFVDNSDKSSSRPFEITVIKHFLGGTIPRGILFNVGESHKTMRRVTLLALRDLGVGKKSIEEKIGEESEQIVERLSRRPESSFHADELRDFFQRGISNIIVSICFGDRREYDDPEFVEVLASLNRLFSFNALSQPSNFLPFLRFLPFFTDKVESFLKETTFIKDFIRKNVNQHRESFDPSNIRDFTDFYLKEQAESDEVQGSDGGQVSNDSKAANLFQAIADLFTAGSETTATSTSWVMYFLANHPSIQTKVYDEVVKVIGPDGRPTYRNHVDMPYVAAVTNEGHRMGTILPMGVIHSASQDFSLGGYTIPRRTALSSNIYALHMDKDYWGDPEVFRPERWLDDKGNLIKHESFMPFSSGPRSCIGEHLARMELFLFIVMFVQRMEFQFEGGQTNVPVTAITGGTRRPGPHRMTVTVRKTSASNQ